MTYKEKVDKYLTDNFNKIQNLRETKKIQWFDVAFDFATKSEFLEYFTVDGRLTIDPEYFRNRFIKLRKKGVVSVLNENKETPINKPKEKFTFQTGKEDKNKGTKEFTFTADNIPTEEEIIFHFNIDITKYKISQIWHKTTPGGKYSISVNLQALKGAETIFIDEKFLEKISEITSVNTVVTKYTSEISKKPLASLIIPKQDSHFNKHDIKGNNCIDTRFQVFTKTLLSQLENVVKTNTLEEIVYIIGSDEFNSEWTEQTTHGTPQQNILSYQEAFEKISEFNIEIIKLLKFYSVKVKVMLLNGNHDHNVSWHLANLLKQVFKKSAGIEIDDRLDNTKVYSYSSNLCLLNHGDKIKPKDLAAKFPILAKEQWSKHSNFYCITGDKHHEVAHDFNGIMWYQVPQLSTATSNWDDKMGFITSKAELLTFLFEEDGLSNILRKQIK